MVVVGAPGDAEVGQVSEVVVGALSEWLVGGVDVTVDERWRVRLVESAGDLVEDRHGRHWLGPLPRLSSRLRSGGSSWERPANAPSTSPASPTTARSASRWSTQRSPLRIGG
jgi:hypothetical protein